MKIIKKYFRKIWFLLNTIGKKPVHFLHLGKTGGSALKQVLSYHPFSKKYTLILHKHKTVLPDIPTGEKIVFFTRNPVSRFVSGFNSRKRKGKPLYDIEWTPEEQAAFTTFDTPNHLAESLTHEDSAIKSKAETAMHSIFHVKSSYWDWFISEKYFLKRKDDILFVGKQEEMNHDFERLKEILGLPKKLRLPMDETHMHKNPANMETLLSDKAISNLEKWYKRDYDFLSLCQKEFGM